MTQGRTRRALERALPLAIVYLGLAALYSWQASVHVTPTIFSDELALAQISRSIAESGHALQRGAPAGYPGLYAYLLAPAWWLGSVPSAYAAIKLIGVLVMTASIFPAYAMARMVVTRPWALFVAAGVGAAPALSYSPILVKEPLAYPVSALALWLIMRYVARPTFSSLGIALGACILGVASRAQLAVLFVVLAVSLLAVGWRTERMRAWRSTWRRGDWIGASVLVVGAAIMASALIGHRSVTWYESTTFYKHDMLEYGVWAGGALAIGVGLVPLIACLAAFVPVRGHELSTGERAFTTVGVAAIAGFGFYAALKTAYLAHHFAIVVAERNLIYLVPILLTGTALFLRRRAGRWWAIAAATAVTLYLVTTTPYELATYPYYEAHGLAILALANRILIWDDTRIEHGLVVITIVGAVALCAIVLQRARQGLVLATTVLLAGFVLAWGITGEIYAANGERRFSDSLYATLPKPPNWLDRATNDGSAVLLGQQLSADPNGISELEFWNRSLRGVWSLDSSAPVNTGRVVTPNLARPDGTLDPDPETGWVVVTPGVQVAGGEAVEPTGVFRLVPLSGPIRLTGGQTGVYPDNWMGGFATYTRYNVPRTERGTVRLSLSRQGACGVNPPGRVTVKLGTVGIDEHDQPAIGRVTKTVHDVINSCETLSYALQAPGGPWRLEVTISPTFVPRELDPTQPDARELGAVVAFAYER